MALNLSNLCSDIRLAASLQNLADSPEWISGKEVAASEALGQIAFQAIGFDHSLGLAAEAGMLDPGVIPPVVAFNLLESLTMMDKGVEAFAAAIQSHAGPSASCR
ncbi:Aspartate ammonia-lyase [Paenibacillus sp. P1XP2]|nr:Aspartate ammonia-lyase [Paenibacillus sp. P1XP2]